MITVPYQIAPSLLPGAGHGLFLRDAVARGQVLIAPDGIGQTFTMDELLAQPNHAELLPSAVRWFEARYTLSPDWPDECFVNHQFEPTGLWLLGFIYAQHDLPAGTELTIDYRHLLGAGEQESFDDAQTGLPIIGFSFAESMRIGARGLLRLFPE